jgi:hypothetical protein
VKTKPPPTKPLPPVEITAIYTGPFTAEQVAAVLAAAPPLPTEAVEDEDIALHCKRMMPPAEAIIRRLEILGGMAAINTENKKAPPSVHTKSLHAIAAAARELLDKIGAGTDGDCGAIPGQIWQSLRWTAESHAERIGGFRHNLPVRRRIGDHEFCDHNSDRQLRDNVLAVAHLAAWAATAEVKTRAQIGRHDTGTWPAFPNDDLWTGGSVNDVLRDVCRIWTEILGRRVATSVRFGDGKADGPLIRFSLACLDLIGVREEKGKPLSADAVRKRIRAIQQARVERGRREKIAG